MNLTTHSTIIEPSFHTCNFALEVLNYSYSYSLAKIDVKITTHVKKSVYLSAFLYNFHTYTIIYFNDPILKIS